MQRDLDFIRELLLAIEAQPAERPWSHSSEYVTPENAKLYGHLDLLKGAGFVTVQSRNLYHGGGQLWCGVNLTWEGFEFLDTIRNDRVWEETKRRVAATVGSVALSVVSELAKSVAKGLMGL